MMVAGGVSIQGTYHDQNQDSFWTYADENVAILAVSDGLGSCKLSALGSHAFCDCVREVLCNEDPVPTDFELICSELHQKWLEHLTGYPIEDCCSTGLFAVWRDSVLTMGAIGDGFVAAVYNDGDVSVLLDEKNDHYINETDCLQESFDMTCWRVLQFPCTTLTGIIGSSDGMEIYPGGEDQIQRFAKEFFASYQRMNSEEIKCNIVEWLSKWPGTDDKTLAFCLEGVNTDE